MKNNDANTLNLLIILNLDLEINDTDYLLELC